MALNGAEIGGVQRIMVEDAQTGAIVVSERRVGILRGGTGAGECAGCGRKGKHHGAPNGGMAKTESMAQFVSENGFEVVGFRIAGKGLRRGVGGEGIAGIEIDVGVENLADLGGDGAAAKLNADLVGGDDARKRKYTRSKGHIGLIKADGVDAIGTAAAGRSKTRERNKGGRRERGAGDAGPHGERLLNGLLDFGQSTRRSLILREDGNGISAKGGAPAECNGACAGELMRMNGAGRTTGRAGGLANVWHDLVEGVAMRGDDGPEAVEKGDPTSTEFSETVTHGLVFRCSVTFWCDGSNNSLSRKTVMITGMLL